MTQSGPAKKGSRAAKAAAALREIALSYPDSYEEFPWGHSAFKVRRKVFLFTAASEDGLGVSAKLPESNREALLLPFASPTRYGLGKSGWVSANFETRETPPIGILSEWIDESYRAIAPKKLVAQLPDDGATPVVSRPETKRKTSKGRSTTKKATKKTTKKVQRSTKKVVKKSSTKKTAKQTTRKRSPRKGG